MLKVTPFRQSPGFCGPACLHVVLQYYGVKKSEAALARLAGGTRGRGTNAHRLAAVAKKLGFKTLVKDLATSDDLRHWVREKKVPVIVDWFSVDDGHYSVVVDIDATHISLMDPELGHVRCLSLETFTRVWFDFPGAYPKSKKDMVIRRMIVIAPADAKA